MQKREANLENVHVRLLDCYRTDQFMAAGLSAYQSCQSRVAELSGFRNKVLSTGLSVIRLN